MGRKKIGFAARLTAALAVLAAVSCLLAWGAERIRVQREYESRQAEILRQARDAERRERNEPFGWRWRTLLPEKQHKTH